MFNRPIKLIISTLLLVLCLQNLAFAEDVDLKIKKQQKEPIKGNISTSENLENVNLNLCKTLKLAKDNNLKIAIQKEKVSENKLKLDEVKNKRLFLFFKFANSGALEKSANYSIKAAEANLKATTNDVLAESSQKYFNLLQALQAKKVAKEFLRRGELSLKENKELLKAGAATKFEVKQTEVFVENLKQKLLEAEIAYMLSSVDIAQYVNAKVFNTNIVPEECTFDGQNNSDLSVKTLNLIPEKLLLNDSVDYALKHRPELEELECKINSLKELIRAAGTDQIKIKTLKSQISQLENTHLLLKNTIKTTVTQALLKLIGTKNQIDVAKKKYELSKNALKQAKVSKEEGFAANKDVLEAQVNLAQSQNDYIKSITSYNLAQINLLKELGMINTDILMKDQPISIPEIVSEPTNGIEDPVSSLHNNILNITQEVKPEDKKITEGENLNTTEENQQ